LKTKDKKLTNTFSKSENLYFTNAVAISITVKITFKVRENVISEMPMMLENKRKEIK
jgi:hypothetical protein